MSSPPPLNPSEEACSPSNPPTPPLKENPQRPHSQNPSQKPSGLKPCTICHLPSQILVRCQVDSTLRWNFVCTTPHGGCWRKVSGGKQDGDGSTERKWYRYGGMWKNRHADGPGSAGGKWGKGGKGSGLKGNRKGAKKDGKGEEEREKEMGEGKDVVEVAGRESGGSEGVD